MNRVSNSYNDHQELNRLKHSAHFDLAPTHKSDSPVEGENNHHQGPNHSTQGTEKHPKSNDNYQSKTTKNDPDFFRHDLGDVCDNGYIAHPMERKDIREPGLHNP